MSNREESFDSLAIEKWLESFFLDPLTSYLDQYTFRIDIYETEVEYILEAMLTDFNLSSIKVFLDQSQITITIEHEDKITSRCVTFPLLVISQKVQASFSNGILEIYISKHETLRKYENRLITVKHVK